MNLFDKINISLNNSPILFVLGAIILIAYTIFIYRITLPKISAVQKSILIFIRSLALLTILFLLFDPVVKILSKEKIYPENFVFIDNSKSIEKFSTEEQIKSLMDVVNKLRNNLKGTINFLTFSKDVEQLEIENLDSIKFTGSSTNFSSIFDFVKDKSNAANIIIVSDGINNEGKNPTSELDDFTSPVFTIGLGDTSTNSDVYVDNIQSNEFIYAERETEIEVTIGNTEFSGKDVIVGLYENQKLLSTKKVTLSSSGVNRIRFPYSNDEEGKHKLLVKINNTLNESNISNNQKSTLINILSTKKKIVLIAGSPSADLAAIKSSLVKNEDFEVYSIIQVSNSKFYMNEKDLKILENSDVIILIGFPNKSPDQQLVKEVLKQSEKNYKPIFLIFSNSIDFDNLKLLKNILPFTISQISNKYDKIQLSLLNQISGILGNTDSDANFWEELPPIQISMTKITPKVNSKLILSKKDNKNIPLFFGNNTAGRKSLVLTGTNIWRWKLRPNNESNYYFSNLLLNSVKWLSINSNSEFFKVNATKKSYKLGEKVVINAKLQDETYNPVINAEIILYLSNKDSINFNPVGNGYYNAEFNVSKPGIYEYTAKIKSPNLNFNEVTGKFNIEKIELEAIQKKMDIELLKSIAGKTGGKYYNISDTNGLIDKLNSVFNSKISYKLLDNELRLSNLELILILIVLFLSLEWIIRKVYRML